MSDEQRLQNTDVVETWEVTTSGDAAHFGLPWNDAGYVLMLLNNRQNGGHATLVCDNADMLTSFRTGWPEEWPEHDLSSCGGHGSN